ADPLPRPRSPTGAWYKAADPPPPAYPGVGGRFPPFVRTPRQGNAGHNLFVPPRRPGTGAGHPVLDPGRYAPAGHRGGQGRSLITPIGFGIVDSPRRPSRA